MTHPTDDILEEDWNGNLEFQDALIEAYEMGNKKALQDFSEMIFKVEGKRITDNNDYISIPIKDWEELKSQLQSQVIKPADIKCDNPNPVSKITAISEVGDTDKKQKEQGEGLCLCGHNHKNWEEYPEIFEVCRYYLCNCLTFKSKKEDFGA